MNELTQPGARAAARPMPALPAAPPAPTDAHGAPLFGAYEGTMRTLSWRGLRSPFRRGPVWRRLHEKRWHYASVQTDEVILALALFHSGYARSVFAYLFDRQRRAMLFDRTTTLPPSPRVRIGHDPATGPRATFGGRRHVLASIARDRPGGPVRLEMSWRGLEVQAELDTDASVPLTVVCPIEDGTAHVTQKSNVLPASGRARVGKRVVDLRGWGGLDFSSGFLARRTQWRWAWGAGSSERHGPVGFNLSQGFLGAEENVVWVDGRPWRCGPAQFLYTRRGGQAPWRILAGDGALDLEFRPDGARAADVDYGLVRSRYVQPVGAFHGSVRLPDGRVIVLAGIPGVTEDHEATW